MLRNTLIATAVLCGAAALTQPPGAVLASAQVQEPDGPVFSARAELVVLHVMVRDRRGNYVPDLPVEAFTVAENGRPQPIQFFAAQDAPVTAGLLIDNSGSMSAARDLVIAAVSAFVETSNPQDEIFALVFNDDVRAVLPSRAPFTNDAAAMRAALAGAVVPRGRTSLHDAILAGLEYVERGTHPRKVLVAVSDGGDNASVATFDDALRRMQVSNTALYTIALVDPLDRRANPNRLRQLADMTGGEAFRPRRLADVPGALARISSDIRHSYTIGYVPADTVRDGSTRRIRVTVRTPQHRGLSVRTREGYIVDER